MNWPTEEHLDDFEITPPGTRGVATLSDGSTLVVTEGGRVTDEYLEFVLETFSPTGGVQPPTVVRYVGPQLTMVDDG